MAKAQAQDAAVEGVVKTPSLPPEVEQLVEQYHMDAHFNRGFQVADINHFRAATDNFKTRLAALLVSKE